MSRTAWFCACTAWALGVAAAARADDMDLALSRLRIAPMDESCGGETGTPGRFCADQELFERLVSELAVAMAPPFAGAAHTVGPRGFQLALSSVVTSIESGELYWRRGTEGDPGAAEDDASEIGVNDDVASAQVWNYLHARKGLPFGFEIGLLLGHGVDTSMWSFGGALKWAVFEGFRTGLGQLPDVSLQASASRSVGSSQATVHLYAVDLTFSKPFVIQHSAAVAPLLGLQLLVANVESAVIDLTPGGELDSTGTPSGDAYARCRPQPVLGQGRIACAEGGDGIDFVNSVVFEEVNNHRVRMFLGGNLRYELLTVTLSLMFDVSSPSLEAEPEVLDSASVAHQVAFNATVGAVLE